MGLKLPQLSDLISLDACRSKIMRHLAGNKVTSLFKMVHREFHTLRRIYRLLKQALQVQRVCEAATNISLEDEEGLSVLNTSERFGITFIDESGS